MRTDLNVVPLAITLGRRTLRSAHTATIAYDLGMAQVRVMPLGPSVIRLHLLAPYPPPEHPPASS